MNIAIVNIDYENDLIREITFLSSNFKSRTGIYPGMTVREYTNIYSRSYIFDSLGGYFYEYFLPIDLQTQKTWVEAVVNSHFDNPKGISYPNSYGHRLTNGMMVHDRATNKFNEDGKIKAISIRYKYKN